MAQTTSSQRGAAADAVQVRGDLAAPGALTVSELQALSPITQSWSMHGQTHTVVGVPLGKVLQRFGVTPGPMGKTLSPAEKRPGYKLAVIASAPDGFQAVFSLAELTEGMGRTQALLVFEVDGQPLPPEQRPLRLVVPTDGEPSRCLYALQKLDIVDLRKIVAPLRPAAGAGTTKTPTAPARNAQ
jgi:DMSO/TMAO reductase YedYZ molybdopterin-dependent catalytic subunit